MSVSKTLPMAAIDAWRSFVEPSRRARWLDLGLRMRTGTKTMGRSARFDVPAEGTRINVYLSPKDERRTTVTVTHVKLVDAADVAAHRAAWKDRLESLAGQAGGAGEATRRSQAS